MNRIEYNCVNSRIFLLSVIFNITRIGDFVLFLVVNSEKTQTKTQNRNRKRKIAVQRHARLTCTKKKKKSKQKTTTGSILELTSGTVEFFCAFLARRRALAFSNHSSAVISKISSVIDTPRPPVAIIVDCHISPTIFLWAKPP